MILIMENGNEEQGKIEAWGWGWGNSVSKTMIKSTFSEEKALGEYHSILQCSSEQN